MSENYLPLILVSAVDLENASKIISEIIDNEVTDSGRNLRKGRVWRLINKYYRVDVEVCPAADGEAAPPGMEYLEAHVIYITEPTAAAEVAAAEARRAGGDVRLLLTGGARTSAALAAWARRRGYEPVPLAERAAEPCGEPCGVARVRDALHAHAWRGLQRLDRRAAGHQCSEELAAADEELAAVERAEAFADALGALAAARAGPASGPAPGDATGDATGPAPGDAARRLRAERLVAAFCRALGAELPRL